MGGEREFFRNPAPVILGFERRASWSRLSSSQFRTAGALLLALMAALAFLTWGRVHVLANGYEIAQLRQRRDALLARNQFLQRRLADLRSLDYVEATARGRLGMVDINPNQVIVLRPRTRVDRLVDSFKALFGGPPSAAGRP